MISIHLRHGNARDNIKMSNNEFEDYTPKAGWSIIGVYEICDCGEPHEFIENEWKCKTCEI
jgi:hypothetical protein